MEKNNSLDPAFVQLAQSNIELREELNREVDINRSNEKKIRRLIRDLEKCEGEIIRRSLTITDQENKINDLKIQISNLQKQLRSALKEIKSNESVIDSKNNQIVGYEEDILKLKARIKQLIPHKKISPKKQSFESSTHQIEMANLNPPRIPRSPRMDDTSRTFESITQSIRNKIQRNPDTSLCNFVEYTLDELNRLYNQSQADLASERENTRIAIDDAMSWQNATAYILDDLDKNHKDEKLMHTFWRVYYEKNTTRLLSEIFALKLLCNKYKNKAQPRAILYGKYNKWKNRTRAKHAKYNKWKLRTRLVRDANLELEERINFLNQRILNLQNNIQNQNMAAVARQHIYQAIGSVSSQIPNYIGQEPPDDYCNKIQQAISFADTMIADANQANANTFTDAHKADIYKSKMAGKYVPIPAQHANINIDTPDQFRAWLRHRYHELTVGTRQASLTKLTQEKFLPTDIPETYEERIRLLLLQTPNNNADALAILWNHLPDELFSRMEITAPGDIDAFFTNLKNIWLKRQPSTFTYNGNRNLPIIISNSTPAPYQPQLKPQENKNRALEHLDSIAERLGYSDDASRNPDALASFIDDELYNRLGYENYHICRAVHSVPRKEPFGQNNNTRAIKKVYTTNTKKKPVKVTYKCSNCGKIGHRKNKCPKGKRSKKVNYTYTNQSEPEDYCEAMGLRTYDQEDEAIVVLEDEDEENVMESEDEETISDSEEAKLRIFNSPQNCFNVKKKAGFL